MVNSHGITPTPKPKASPSQHPSTLEHSGPVHRTNGCFYGSSNIEQCEIRYSSTGFLNANKTNFRFWWQSVEIIVLTKQKQHKIDNIIIASHRFSLALSLSILLLSSIPDTRTHNNWKQKHHSYTQPPITIDWEIMRIRTKWMGTPVLGTRYALWPRWRVTREEEEAIYVRVILWRFVSV